MRALLVDLSSVLVPIWKMSGNDPDPNHCSTATVSRIRDFARRWEGSRTIICCDSRRSFRKEISADYKANREKKPEDLYYQRDRAKEILASDGFPVLEFDGFEADDVIASCCATLSSVESLEGIVVVSADKDLLQLVRDTDEDGRIVPVQALSCGTGALFGVADVVSKFGVHPWHMGDYLALVGDVSDNIKGADGIGDKKAAALLAKFGSLVNLFAVVEPSTAEQWAAHFPLPTPDTKPDVAKWMLDARRLIGGPAVHASLKTGGATVALARRLVTLRDDVPVPSAADLLKEPVQTSLAPEMDIDADPFADDVDGEPVPPPAAAPRPQSVPPSPPPASQPRPISSAPQPAPAAPVAPVATAPAATPAPTAAPAPAPAAAPEAPAAMPAESTALAVYNPAEWQLALEPRNPQQAIMLAGKLFNSRLFTKHGNADAVLAVILAGRSMGLDAVTALRGLMVVEGQLQIGATLMVGLVMRSGKAKYFRLVETTDTIATYETWRIGEPDPIRLSYTIEEATAADLVKTTKDGKKSTWIKRPKTMLRHRCATELARAVYPDVVANCYDEDEINEIRDSRGRAA